MNNKWKNHCETMFNLLSCLVNSYGVIRGKEKHIASCYLWLVGTCMYVPLQCYRIDSRLLIWNAYVPLTPQWWKASFLQLRFTDKEAKTWQGSSLLTVCFKKCQHWNRQFPSSKWNYEKFIWKSLWSEVLMKIIMSWLLAITQMDNFLNWKYTFLWKYTFMKRK